MSLGCDLLPLFDSISLEVKGKREDMPCDRMAMIHEEREKLGTNSQGKLGNFGAEAVSRHSQP